MIRLSAGCILFLYMSVVGATASAARRPFQSDYRLMFRLLSMKHCDAPNLGIRFGNMTVTMHRNGGHYVDCNFTIVWTSPFIRSAHVSYHRCKDGMSSNTCEFMGTYNWKRDVCADIVLRPNMPWAPVVRSVTPRLTCPVKVGQYQAINATWDFNTPVMRSLVGENIVKGRLMMKDSEGNMWQCVEGVLQGFKVAARTPRV